MLKFCKLCKGRVREDCPFWADFRAVRRSACPTGKSASAAGSACPVPLAKIFGFRRRANQIYHSRRPAPNEGRCATSRNVEQDAVDADVLADEQHMRRTAKSCGP